MSCSVVRPEPSAGFCVFREDLQSDFPGLLVFDKVLRDKERYLPATDMLAKVPLMCEKIMRFGRETGQEAGARAIVNMIRAVDVGSNRDTRAREVRDLIVRLYTEETTPDGRVYIGFLYTEMNARLRKASQVMALSYDEIIVEQKRVLGVLYEFAELLVDAIYGLAPASDKKLTLFRGTTMTRAGFDAYTASIGKVIVLPSFTSLSEDLGEADNFPLPGKPPRAGQFKAFIQLDSIRRPRVGGFATAKFRREEEVVLPSFSMVFVESTGLQVRGRPKTT
jgi:hypothetical protein